MSIKETFLKRKEYDEANPNFELPELPELYTKYYLDSWHVSPFYGRVDTLGIPIIPKQSLLRYCTFGSDKDQYLVLQPVVDFFFPLREQYENYYSRGAFNKNSKYFKKDLLPKKAFLNSNLEYPELMKTKYRNFIDHLLTNNKFNSIRNYDDFLIELMIYIKTTNTYFTRAGYVESTDYSLLHTGLSIEIYKEQSSNDDERLSFYNDINNDAFLELCIRNNMKIDREIPWRLFLDIRTKSNGISNTSFSEKIKELIPDYKDDLQLFFDTYYDRVIPYDDNSYVYFVEFNELLQSFYLTFIKSSPIYKSYLINKCGKANVKTIERDLLPDTIDVSKYVDLYLQFRNIELNKVVSEEILSQVTLMSNLIFKSENNNGKDNKKASIKTFKYHTNNIGTLAYRNPSLYEIDQKQKNG